MVTWSSRNDIYLFLAIINSEKSRDSREEINYHINKYVEVEVEVVEVVIASMHNYKIEFMVHGWLIRIYNECCDVPAVCCVLCAVCTCTSFSSQQAPLQLQ